MDQVLANAMVGLPFLGNKTFSSIAYKLKFSALTCFLLIVVFLFLEL